MRSLQENLGAIQARGVRIAAISVDPPDTTREHALKMGFTFDFLSDAPAAAIRAYDLLHEGAMGDAATARPAEFLVDEAGIVRWRNITGDYRVRLVGEDFVNILDALGRRPR